MQVQTRKFRKESEDEKKGEKLAWSKSGLLRKSITWGGNGQGMIGEDGPGKIRSIPGGRAVSNVLGGKILQ